MSGESWEGRQPGGGGGRGGEEGWKRQETVGKAEVEWGKVSGGREEAEVTDIMKFTLGNCPGHEARAGQVRFTGWGISPVTSPSPQGPLSRGCSMLAHYEGF